MNGNSGEAIVTVKDVTANPAPLGLLGFGMTTLLLNIHNTGYYELGSVILAMGIFIGGFLQVIAGVMEWKKGNTFGTVAFCAYGFFWLTLVALIVGPKYGIGEPSSPGLLGWFFFFWGLFTFAMFVGTLRINKMLQLVFGTLLILFWLLAIRDWAGSEIVGKIAGWEGIIVGLLAIYGSVAQILNEVYAKTVLPIGPVKKH